VADLVNTVSWSASRISKLEQCPRAYWWHYYGSWKGWERGAMGEARRAYTLKQILSLPAWAGKVVHEIIAVTIINFQTGGRWPSVEELHGGAQSMLRAQWIASLRHWTDLHPKRGTRLAPHERGEEVHRDETDALKVHVYGCLRAWREGPWPSRIEAEKDSVGQPEAMRSVPHDCGASVFAAPDLFMEGQVVDWKTGTPRDSDLLQQKAYAWAASTEQGRLVRSRLVYLKDGAESDMSYEDTEQAVAEMDQQIGVDVALMRDMLNPDGETVDKERCEARPGPLCRWCSFLELCEEGQSA